VGDHIRPRVRVHGEWHWPVNIGISTEFGYQRRSFSPDTWTWEIQPIVDKQLGRWYMAVNPALKRSFRVANEAICAERLFACSLRPYCGGTLAGNLDLSGRHLFGDPVPQLG
jgi:hypothetical protein